jgi:hypothetical protein
MNRIEIDQNIQEKLRNINHSVELCDSAGNVLGRFIPKLDPKEWEPLEPQISQEEIERRLKSNEKRYTTTEVIAYLEKP